MGGSAVGGRPGNASLNRAGTMILLCSQDAAEEEGGDKVSGTRIWLPALLGTIFLALTVRADAVDPATPVGTVLAAAAVPAVGVPPTDPKAMVPPGPSPPDESLQVRVEQLDDVVEGLPLRFRVFFPDRFNPAGLELTYSVVQGAENAREGVDFRGLTGPVTIDAGSVVGTFEIPTLLNPASGGATLLVQVRQGDQVLGRAIGTITNRPAPGVELTSTPAIEGEELVFEVAIDPAAEVRGPWTYDWRVEAVDSVEGASAVENVDFQPSSGTLQFDAEGRPLEVRIPTLRNESVTEPRSLRLIVSAGDAEWTSLGMIEDSEAAPPPPQATPLPEPEAPAPTHWDWGPIAIGVAVLLVLATGAWWMLRRPPAPDVTNGAEDSAPQEAVLPELVVETSSGPRAFEPTGLGVPELVIETKAGPAVFTPPARLPVEPVGGQDG